MTKPRTDNHPLRRALCGLLTLCALQLMLPVAAGAAPVFRLGTHSSTTAAPNSSLSYGISLRNVGDEAAFGTATLVAQLPPGIVASAAFDYVNVGWSCAGDGPGPAPSVEGAQVVTCSRTNQFLTGPNGESLIVVGAEVGALAEGGVETATVDLYFQPLIPPAPALPEGGACDPAPPGTPCASTYGSVRIDSTPQFGLVGYDMSIAGPGGAAEIGAGTHPPSQTVRFDIERSRNETVPNIAPGDNEAWPVQEPRDVVVALPPGFLGSVAGLEQCTMAELAVVNARPLCPSASQVGVSQTRGNGTTGGDGAVFERPVFNMEPPPGAAARFSFENFSVITAIDVRLSPTPPYRLIATVRYASQGIPVSGSDVTLWGNPFDEAHRGQRACPGGVQPSIGEVTCAADGALANFAFLRNPTSCTGAGLPSAIQVDSWQEPARFGTNGMPDLSDPRWATATGATHRPPGFPAPSELWGDELGTEGCEAAPFEPSLTVTPTTSEAASPTGLRVSVSVPQDCWGEEVAATCQADLRDTSLLLPPGMSVNPSAAAGQGACRPSQIGLESRPGQAPIEFNGEPSHCPDSSKIGTVAVTTPLLDHDLAGSVYLASQSDNPFGSLLALYFAIEDPETGTLVKLAARVVADEASGRLKTVLDDAPQVPFDEFQVNLFGGSRAALRNPASCGVFSARATLAGWNGAATVLSPGFSLDSGPGGGPCPAGGFDPRLSAGTANPLAGSTSPFTLRLTRNDGEQELGAITATLPPGLSGYLRGIPYCPDAALAAVSSQLGAGAGQEASPSCPSASRLGTVTVGAGAGSSPFYTTSGRAYLAGPFGGAPLSLAVIAPAVAGPFDLGSVVVRNALKIDSESGQITAVSDPLPRILHGIPLDLRDVRVDLDRERFTLNPTSCNEMQIDSRISSSGGVTATPSVRFQVAGCDALSFKPRLSLRLRGKTRRGANPALRAVLTMPKPGANLAKASVALPRSEFLDQSHIRTICTRVQFNEDAGNGTSCPKGSIYGYALAWSPIVDYPVRGPVILRSSSHKLPDMVLALHGPPSQPVAINAVGRIDSIRGGIRTRFVSVPDLPVSKLVLRMRGGRRSLLQNSRNICRGKPRATALFDGHNGKVYDTSPVLRARCGKARKQQRHHR